MPDQNSVS